MILLLAAHAVVGIGLVAFGARLGRAAFVVGALPLTLSTVWTAAQLG